MTTTLDTLRASSKILRTSEPWLPLFVASAIALFFELLIIRYLSTEVRVFAYLKNLPLIASFLGLGAGMIFGRRTKLERIFPLVALITFILIRFAPNLGLTHIGFPDQAYILFGNQGREQLPTIVLLLKYVAVVIGFLAFVVSIFLTLGGLVGESLKRAEPLWGYGINLAGSLAGILVFTALAFFDTPPIVWLAVGFLALVPYFRRQPVALSLFAVIILVHFPASRNTYWSHYYRIDVAPLPKPAGYDSPSGYTLNVNHDYHQRMMDLSDAFSSRFPDFEPHQSSRLTYQFPYFFVDHPRNVLVIGAGTGNDVAAALRHAAQHVDAVEIDPLILELGRKYHPEGPYSSPRVTAYVQDARAFLTRTDKHYDLITFAYLDSHTMLTSFSAIRLDNYVYTIESITAARKLLTPNGTMVLAFSGGVPFINERIYAMLTSVFRVRPLVYKTGYDSTGIVYVEGAGTHSVGAVPIPEVGNQIDTSSALIPNDSWPFLYLRGRSIPASMMVILIAFLIGARRLLRSAIGTAWTKDPETAQLFLLGAGFMLLETKGTTDIALLFGSTWVVNGVVISAFLLTAFLANTAIQFVKISIRSAYLCLFPTLAITLLLRAGLFTGASIPAKLLASILITALPVFFSGMVFSRIYKQSARPDYALGVNLFGAMTGGILENATMIGGTPILIFMAFALYGLAAFAARATNSQARAVTALGGSSAG